MSLLRRFAALGAVFRLLTRLPSPQGVGRLTCFGTRSPPLGCASPYLQHYRARFDSPPFSLGCTLHGGNLRKFWKYIFTSSSVFQRTEGVSACYLAFCFCYRRKPVCQAVAKLLFNGSKLRWLQSTRAFERCLRNNRPPPIRSPRICSSKFSVTHQV